MHMSVSPKERGLFFVMVGPGGAGKNRLMKFVLMQLDNLMQLPTATTRPMRDDEQPGREHDFVTPERFEEMIQNNELLEYQEVTRNRFYGIQRATVEDNLGVGKNLIADIDVLGAAVVKRQYPDDSILIFVTVPGDSEAEMLQVLAQRMQNRDDGVTKIEDRLQRARELEFPFMSECDYVIVNDDFDRAAQELLHIITKEMSRVTE